MQKPRAPTIQESRPLTANEFRFFRSNGFLKLPWRLPAELVEAVKEQATDNIEQGVEPLTRDDRGDVMRLSAAWERGGAIRRVLGGAEVVPALRSLLGPDVELMLNRQNHVTLRRQGDRTAMSTELHRDVRNWSRTICTILFFLEDTNLENGCTHVIPGSHLLPDVAPGLIAETDPWWIASGVLEQRISIPMPAGGLLAIDGMVMHAAGRNRTDGTRMALAAGYHVVDHHAGTWDPQRVVVCGKRRYRGNDAVLPEARSTESVRRAIARGAAARRNGSNPDAGEKPRILFAPAREHTGKVFAPEVMARMEEVFDVDRNDRDTDLTESELRERIGGCDGLVTGWGASDPRVLRPRGAMALTPAIMEAADRLRIIAHAAGSVRQMLGAVWQDYIAARGICVVTATEEIGYNVAETALGLMIMSAKRLTESALHVRDTGGWRSPDIAVDEQHLFGATVGIVGASDVGRRVMLLLRSFDVRLLLFDPYLDAEEAGALNAEKVALDELFARADIVSLHAPSIPETRHMVGAAQLRRLRDGALLVNTARGSLIDQEALIREAGSGRIRVALDVTTPEPLPPDSPLRQMADVIITPHIAGQGRYGHIRIGAATAYALENYFAGWPVKGAVTHARWERLA